MTLPEGWGTATIEELAGIDGLVSDGDWVETKDQDPAGEVRLTQLADVGEGEFRDRSARFMTREAAARLRCTFLQSGDALIARMPDPIGRACLFSGLDQPAVTAVDVMIWRTDGVFAGAEWFVRWINSPAVRKAMADGAGGTTRQRIAGGRVKELELPVPPLAEQRRIVAKLDALTARLARARAELDRVPVLARKLRQAAVVSAFNGEMTASWRDVRPTGSALSREQADVAYERVVGARRKKEPAPIDWQPDITLPETWRWASVDEVVAIVQYGTSAKTSEDHAGVPVLRMGNIQRGEIDWTSLKYLPAKHHEFPALLLSEGDVVFNRTNSFELVGKSAIFRGASSAVSFASYLIRVRCAAILPPLLVRYLNSPFGRAWVGGVASQQVGQANVNGSKLKSLGIPLPPEAEQEELVRRLDAAFARADSLEAEAARARALLDRLEAKILARAFRGELVPQDPNDEPATTLLARIRAQRAATPRPKRGQPRKETTHA